MDCESIQKGRLADAYRAGRLSPEEVAAYERHFLSCDTCFAELDPERQVAARLQAKGEELFASEVEAEKRGRLREHALGQADPARPVRPWFMRRPIWAGGLATAGALFALALMVQQNAERTRAWQGLWVPRPHPYVASELRGTPNWPEFEQGIAAYQAGRYREAAGLLQDAARRTPTEDVVALYLGVSLLLSDQPREARRVLEEAAGRTPTSRVIRWYLAQAELRTGRVRRAQELARSLAGSPGAYQSEADSLLGRIAARTR